MAVLEVTCSLIGWLGLYSLFCCAFARRGPEWNCRLVTLCHGVAIVLLTAYVLFVDGPWPFTHAGQWPTAEHEPGATLNFVVFCATTTIKTHYSVLFCYVRPFSL